MLNTLHSPLHASYHVCRTLTIIVYRSICVVGLVDFCVMLHVSLIGTLVPFKLDQVALLLAMGLRMQASTGIVLGILAVGEIWLGGLVRAKVSSCAAARFDHHVL